MIFDDRAALIRTTRAGDTIWIEDLALLAEPKSKDVRSPVNDLRDAIEQIEAIKSKDGKLVVTLIEVSSGRSNRDPTQRREMIAEAAWKITAGGRRLPSDQARENGRKGWGRRKRIWSDVELGIIDKHWFDNRHESNKIAAEVITAEGRKALGNAKWKVSPMQCWKAMTFKHGKGKGGSGRSH